MFVQNTNASHYRACLVWGNYPFCEQIWAYCLRSSSKSQWSTLDLTFFGFLLQRNNTNGVLNDFVSICEQKWNAESMIILINGNVFLKAGPNLMIVTRPTLDLMEVLTRIAQREMRQVIEIQCPTLNKFRSLITARKKQQESKKEETEFGGT